MIEVKVYEVGKSPELRTIDENSLQEMQKIVGGYLESVDLSGGLVLICDEDGQSKGLPAHRCGILGTFFVARQSWENFVTLTDADKITLDEGDWR